VSGRLGSARAYSAAIHQRGGARRLYDLDHVVSVQWSRKLNEISDATVVIAKAGSACCAALATLMPWQHELSIYRDGVLVWQGPVWYPHENAATFTIEARDLAGWWPRWPATVYGKLASMDGVSRMRTVLDAHFARNICDPGMAAWLTYHTGAAAVALEIARGDSIDDVAGQLVDAAMDYTSVGRRIVIMPTGYDYGGHPVASLTEEDLGGDIESGVDGDAILTWVTALGAENPATGAAYYADLSTPINTSVWGLHYASTTSDEETSSTALKELARAVLLAGAPPQRVIRLPDDAALSPRAPVSVEQLVCGARVDILLGSGWCQALAERARLVGVSGRWEAGADEAVGVSLVAAGPVSETDEVT